MSLTVVSTESVEGRYRGFLASIMLEVSPTLYLHPKLTQSVRDRIWDVVSGWHEETKNGSIVMVFQNSESTEGIEIRCCGQPPSEIVDAYGILLIRRPKQAKTIG